MRNGWTVGLLAVIWATVAVLAIAGTLLTEPRDPAVAAAGREASFPVQPCGVDVFHRWNSQHDAATWECVHEAIQQGETAQVLRLSLGQTQASMGDGTWWLLTVLPGGALDVIEADVQGYHVTEWRRYRCSELAAAEERSPIEFTGCDEPVSSPLTGIEGSEGLLICGFEIGVLRVDGANESGRRCILDALADGRTAQYVVTRMLEGRPFTEVVTVTARGDFEVYQDSIEWGRHRLQCTELRDFDWVAAASDCTKPRLADGFPTFCGAQFIVDGRATQRGGGEDCLRTHIEQGRWGQLLTMDLDENGDGAVWLLLNDGMAMDGQPRPGVAITEYGVAAFEVIEQRWTTCEHWELSVTRPAVRTDLCRFPEPRPVDERYRWDGPPGHPARCGVEILAGEPSHVGHEARRCLVEAFERGDPAQLISIDLHHRGAPHTTAITAFEPGVLHVLRDTTARVTREQCSAIESLDGAEGVELAGCAPAR